MNIVRTVFRIKPKNSNNKKSLSNIKNEFYIASNEFSKQKLISFYGIEDCPISSGNGSCLKLENIFGASTISRGSNATLINSQSNSLNPISDSIENIKKNINKENGVTKKNSIKYKSDDNQINIAINDTINELKLKLKERNNNIKTSRDTIKNENQKSNYETNLINNLTSADTIYHQSLEIDKYYTDKPEKVSSSNNIDYLSNNPDVVIDINSLKVEKKSTSYLNKSNSSIINNMNIHENEEKDIPKNEIIIDIDNATKITKVTKENEDKEEKEKNVKFVNKLYTKKMEKLNSSIVPGLQSNLPSSSTLDDISDSSNSDENIYTRIGSSHGRVTRSYDYLNIINKKDLQKNRLYSSYSASINKVGLLENQAFINKLIDRYSPQQRLSVSFNHIYDPLFVTNNLSKRYDIELKHYDISIKDIYNHGLPYLLRSKRPLIEFCKELIKECQIEILFFINDVCDFQKKLFTKQSDIFKDGKDIYTTYLSNNAICPIEVTHSLKIQCVRDLKSLKKECFHGIALHFYKNLDFIYEEFKAFVLKEHYENNTEFDKILITYKSDSEKKELEDELIKLVELYYKSSDDALIAKQKYIVERIQNLCQNLLN